MKLKEENRIPNRLVNEKSPYLLQHAHNPVDWFPWGDEAFNKAKAEDKPVFLSIGYSTCHWCHVMEGESFEDAEVAELLNRNYVAIKVDKEERPDIDSVYMTVCQAITGEGGWPLTILMTPDQKPFFAGTYFPKHAQYRRIGLMELLEKASEQWKTNKAGLAQSGEEITKALSRQTDSTDEDSRPSQRLIEQSVEMLEQIYDSTYGGFGSAPKFPSPHNILFLLRYHSLTGHQEALQMAEKTLRQMYRGGLFDHIGYGFCRYSTDSKWLAPHFEKMLYDNALLIMAYAQAYQATGNELYQNIVQKTVQYISREMTHPEGGFYCAQDADSEGEEGKYYLFTPEEVINILGSRDGGSLNRYFDITEAGNFEGKNIPNLIDNEAYAHPDAAIDSLCTKLYEYRRHRVALRRDDKILSGWNALMIAALSIASRCLGEDTYSTAARRAMEMMDRRLYDAQGALQVSYRDGHISGDAHLDDYAYLCWAYLELYRTTFDAQYLERSAKLCDVMLANFWDEDASGFFLSGQKNEKLILRPKEWYDGALPSGNSVAAYCLVAMDKLTGETKWRDAAQRQLACGSAAATTHPIGYNFFNMAMMMDLYPARELVCILPDDASINEVKTTLDTRYQPNLSILVITPQNAPLMHTLAPFTIDYPPAEQPTFYLCENKACSAPVTGIVQLKEALEKQIEKCEADHPLINEK